jgi:hypothetical protein
MSQDAFTAPGRFYRGNLHTHSTLTDAVLDPEEVCRRYKAEGYDFIALTDHFVGLWGYPLADTRPFRDDEFTTLLGAELHSGAMENGRMWHILAVGLPLDFAPSDSPNFTPKDGQETGPQIAARARAAGAFVAVAHPEWSGLTMADALSIEAAHAVEVYNHSAGVTAGRPAGFHTADLLLSEGRKLSLIATDDAHFEGPDHFGGWVMVKAETNTPDALLVALKAGHFYATQGPEIHGIEMADKRITVRCSAAQNVIVMGKGHAALATHGASMTHATLPLAEFADSPWIRVMVTDRAGLHAWSNPIWF